MDRALAAFLVTPETLLAYTAVERLLADSALWAAEEVNPLYLYGPSGCGKTHLVGGLLDKLSKRRPELRVDRLDASALEDQIRSGNDACELKDKDVVVVENLHRAAGHETSERWLIELIDAGRAERRQLVFTSVRSPRQLGGQSHPLASRLLQGLAVHLAPLGSASRQALFQEFADRKQLPLTEPVAHWLRDRLPASGREMNSLISKLDCLAKASGGTLELDEVKRAFAPGPQSNHILGQVADRVAEYFELPVRSLRGQGRSRRFMMPRQIGMYVARKVTRLSFQKVGRYFGNRDHSTVLHACRRVQEEMKKDRRLAHAVRDIQSLALEPSPS